jgi:hypothetical protein
MEVAAWRSSGEAVGGGPDALEEHIAVIERQRTGGDGRKDTVERTQDGVAIGEGTEVNCTGPESAQASAGAQIEVPMIVAALFTGGDDRTTRGSIGLGGGAEYMFHRFS